MINARIKHINKYIILVFISISLICIFILKDFLSDKFQNTISINDSAQNISDIKLEVNKLELKKVILKDIDKKITGLEYKLYVTAPANIIKDNSKIGIKLVYPDNHKEMFGVLNSRISYDWEVIDISNDLYSLTFTEAAEALSGEVADDLIKVNSDYVVSIYLDDKIIKSIIIPKNSVKYISY